MEAGEHPSMMRLLPAGPWQYTPHPQGGTLASWKTGSAPALESFAEARECADGLWYLAPKKPATAGDLRRDVTLSVIPITLYGDPTNGTLGLMIDIALATSSPRKLVFSPAGLKTGDYLTEYARLANALREKAHSDKDIYEDDPDLARFVLLALQQTYRVTEEVLTDLCWLSTADFLPILLAAWGRDPKAVSTGEGI